MPRDYTQAAVWYRKAAEQDDTFAQYHLGLLYEEGSGVPQSHADAYFWLDIAAAGAKGTDQDGAAKSREAVRAKLSPEELSKVQERAANWLAEHPAKP